MLDSCILLSLVSFCSASPELKRQEEKSLYRCMLNWGHMMAREFCWEAWLPFTSPFFTLRQMDGSFQIQISCNRTFSCHNKKNLQAAAPASSSSSGHWSEKVILSTLSSLEFAALWLFCSYFGLVNLKKRIDNLL